MDEGFYVAAGIDVDAACRYPYESNNGVEFIECDVTDLSASYVASLYPAEGFRVLSGCAPCQKFSTYTRHKVDINTEKWGLLRVFAKIAHQIRPTIVTMENVNQLARHKVFSEFVESLEDAGYVVSYYEVDCQDYGVPQTRKRLVLFGSLFGSIQMAEPNHGPGSYLTVRDQIEDLEQITAGGVSETDPMHRSSGLTELNLRRIKASRPGGTWREWSEDLKSPCHRKQTGKTYPSVYGRMDWDLVGPTITTQAFGYGNGRFGHPEQDRGLSLREMALLQTFPHEYRFVDSQSQVYMKTIGRLIGNAVPVALGKAIARSIRAHLEVHGG